MFENPWSGVFAATLCPFLPDHAIDKDGLQAYTEYLAAVPGLCGLVCNGHTGEVMGLRPRERAEVIALMKEAAGDMRVISGICCEGSFEAIDHVQAAKEAGADAVLLMPPHHWLRFGRPSVTAVGYFEDVAAGVDIPIIVHQYPDWTKATYTLEEMLALTEIEQVVAIKMGTRNMSRLGHEHRVLKEAAPDIPLLSCHDEFLLSSLLAGADGALVGFAGFVPELIVDLVQAVLAGDYVRAYATQEVVYRLNKCVYRFGEPSSEAHQRMKMAMFLQGRFPSMDMRPPLRPLNESEVQRIQADLSDSGFEEWYAERGLPSAIGQTAYVA